MPSYKKSQLTQSAVIESSKQLFYDNGYVNTHYDDIVEKSGINSGLIYYHFKKKSNIAGIIYSQLMLDIKNSVYALYGNEADLQICTAIELRVMWQLIFTDEKFKRFLYEISIDRVLIEEFRKVGKDFFELHNNEFHLEFDTENLKVINAGCSAVETELIIGYAEKLFKMKQKQFCDFDIRTVYEFMSIDYRRIEDILNISEEFLKHTDIILEDYFQLTLRRKKKHK